MEVPPVLIRDGGVIREGFNAELDELRDLANGATGPAWPASRSASGADQHQHPQVGYNKVHGFTSR